jgi:hypothetical protein
MTQEEGDRYIALALLHGPSTVNDIVRHASGGQGNHDPLHRSERGPFGDRSAVWWVYRDCCCKPNFRTAAEAARHYCRQYGVEP